MPPDDMTITFPAHNGPAGWFGSDPRIKFTNGDVLNGEIDAKLKYFNDEVGLHKEMTIKRRVVAKLPKRGRVVSIEWWPDAECAGDLPNRLQVRGAWTAASAIDCKR